MIAVIAASVPFGATYVKVLRVAELRQVHRFLHVYRIMINKIAKGSFETEPRAFRAGP